MKLLSDDALVPSNDDADTRAEVRKQVAPSKANAATQPQVARSQTNSSQMSNSQMSSSQMSSFLIDGSQIASDPEFESVQPEPDEKGTNKRSWQFFGASVSQELKVDNVVEKISSGQLWVVNSRRRNGLIVLREFHAEFAGPGAAVGGLIDDDIVDVIPIGNLSLLAPDSSKEHQNALKIRLQWIRLTQNFTDQPEPDDRARMILEQFKTYFDQETVDSVSDKAFAMLVGVLPQTIHRVRSGFVW
ncbi:MAG: hypothetical protein AAF716_09440 [Cyanobacteria bacterium P01_D01_bin.1]